MKTLVMRDNTKRQILNELLPTESVNELYLIRFGEYGSLSEAVADESVFTHDNLSEFTIIDDDGTSHSYTNYQLVDIQFSKNGTTGTGLVLCYIQKLSNAEKLLNQIKSSITDDM